MTTSPPSARQSAYVALTAVLDKSVTLADALERATPPERDRAFVQNLVTTTLRRLGQIDALITHCLDKPFSDKGRNAQHLLRLGVCQLLFLDVADHAAIGETVESATGRALAPYRKLINAVLRRLQREGNQLLAAQDGQRLNTPDWLWTSWCAAYGEKSVRAIAGAHQVPPPLDLSVRTETDPWSKLLDASVLPTGSLRLQPRGSIPKLPGFNDGAWWVQDIAASLPVKLLGDVRGLTVMDLCAAPGGKTAQLASAGAHVIAVDRSENRLKRLHSNMERLNLNVETVTADAATWNPAVAFDAVLLDAPCSATGTIRRHPDVAWLKSPKDVAKLSITQDRLLNAATDMLRPGGTIVYCTCSLQPEEGIDRIETLLKNNPSVTRVPVQAHEIGGLSEAITPAGDLRTLPCHMAEQGGMDGFYACRLRKEG